MLRGVPIRWLLVLAALVLASTLGAKNGLGRSDQLLYDVFLSARAHTPSEQVVIVAIDDASLAELGRWPWPRERHIDLIERIMADAPRAIGLDLLLSEPDTRTPGLDERLAQALHRSERVVLPVFMTSVNGWDYAAVLPIAPLARAAAALGHVSVELDNDGIVRSVFLQEGTGGEWLPHFSVALLRLAGWLPETTELPGRRDPDRAPVGLDNLWHRDYWLPIAFAGPPGTIAQVSARDVLQGRLPPGLLEDRIVLVGSTAVGLGDAYPTPVSGQSMLMPGVEISANIIDNLLSGHLLQVAQPWQNAVFSLLPVLLLAIGLWRLPPRGVLLLVSALLLATLAASYLALRLAGYWFAPAAALLTLTLLYPLWNWCRLEAAMLYLDDELRRLHTLDTALGMAAPLAPGDPLDRRINSLRHAADELRALHVFISSTMESLPDITLVVDDQGRVLLANEAAAHYFQAAHPSALRARRLTDLFTAMTPVREGLMLRFDQDLPTLLGAHPDARANGIECQDAHQRDFLLKIVPCADPQGRLSLWILSLIDVSALREAERRRDAALRFLSHDMRSPQTAIQSLLRMYRSDPGAMSHHEVLDRIESHVGRTQALAESFVQLARAESVSIKREFVDYVAIMMDATDACWAAARTRDIRLETDLTDEPAHGVGDPGLLTRALINLLDNAIKYSPRGSTVHARVAITEPGWVCLAVRDQGRGIAPEDHAKVFQRFARFGPDAHDGTQGVGLGLAFASAVAQRHGGRICFQSAPGQGSEFQLHLKTEAL